MTNNHDHLNVKQDSHYPLSFSVMGLTTVMTGLMKRRQLVVNKHFFVKSIYVSKCYIICKKKNCFNKIYMMVMVVVAEAATATATATATTTTTTQIITTRLHKSRSSDYISPGAPAPN